MKGEQSIVTNRRTDSVAGALHAYQALATTASIILLVGLLAGCQAGGSADESTTSTTPLASSAGSQASDRIPTISELKAAVSLTSEQTAVVEASLARWSEAQSARRGTPGNEPPAAAGDTTMPFGAPPAEQFLMECSNALNTDQFVALASVLKTHRPTGPPIAGQGPRGPAGAFRQHAEQMAKELSLTEEQTQKLEALMKLRRPSIRNSDAPSDPEAMARVHDEMREQLDTALQEILSPEQYAKMVSMRASRDSVWALRRSAGAETRVARHVEFLRQTLQLTDSQGEAIKQMLMSSAKTAITDGPPEAAQAGGRWAARHAAIERNEAEIRKLLTADQARRFDALCELRVAFRGA